MLTDQKDEQLEWRLEKVERALRTTAKDLKAANQTLDKIMAMLAPPAPKPRPNLTVLPGEKGGKDA